MTAEIRCDDDSEPVVTIEKGMSKQFDTPKGPFYILGEEHGFKVIVGRWNMFLYGITGGLFFRGDEYVNGAMEVWGPRGPVKKIRATE